MAHHPLSRRDLLQKAKALAAAAPLLGLASCGRAGPEGGATRLAGATMGTIYGVVVADLPGDIDRRILHGDLEGILERVDAQMSTYRSDSELSRFNDASPGVWVEVSADTLAVTEAALGVARLSAGAFDPTVGPLVDDWGFGPGPAVAPSAAGGRSGGLATRVGHGLIETRRAPSALRKRSGGVRVDLSGIAKGFGLDRIAAHLEGIGAGHYLIEIGGELRGRGRAPQGRPWRVGIEQPEAGARAVRRVVRLDGRALATSGDYLDYFERRGRRYCHIIDPRSGRPVDHDLASVSVVAGSAMRADALSTALMVLGPEAGLRLALRENIAALFVLREGARLGEKRTPAFEPYLEEAPPWKSS
jgi:thiamine biosynthesis lipoprotein